jgi:BirA family biotin operon repressor/biotin-[acetyl-CoA-carboxylase] ligase
MQVESLEEALGGLPLGPIRYFARIGSTNDEAARWIEEGAPDLALVVADEQTAGRGRAGRKWITSPGAALAISLVLRPPFSRKNRLDAQSITARLTGLAALAVSQALKQDYHLDPLIKWPNDILLEGRKVAGILVEVQWQGNSPLAAILGIGVNVGYEAVPPAEELAFPASCIQASLKSAPARLPLLRAILAHLLTWRERLGEDELIAAWESSLAYMGEWVQVLGPDTGKRLVYQGRIIGLNRDGRLILRNPMDQISTIDNGEIRLRPVDAP